MYVALSSLEGTPPLENDYEIYFRDLDQSRGDGSLTGRYIRMTHGGYNRAQAEFGAKVRNSNCYGCGVYKWGC